jgi:hypothetical protein
MEGNVELRPADVPWAREVYRLAEYMVSWNVVVSHPIAALVAIIGLSLMAYSFLPKKKAQDISSGK